MQRSVTLSQRDIAKLTRLAARLTEIADELSADGGRPRRRRRKPTATAEPVAVRPKLPRTKRALAPTSPGS